MKIWLETVPVAHSDISPPVILPGHVVGSSFAMVHLFAHKPTFLSLDYKSPCVVSGSVLTEGWDRAEECTQIWKFTH